MAVNYFIDEIEIENCTNLLTVNIVTTVERNYVCVLFVKIAGTLAHITCITFSAQIGRFAWVHHEANWAEYLKTLYGAHANLKKKKNQSSN